MPGEDRHLSDTVGIQDENPVNFPVLLYVSESKVRSACTILKQWNQYMLTCCSLQETRSQHFDSIKATQSAHINKTSVITYHFLL